MVVGGGAESDCCGEVSHISTDACMYRSRNIQPESLSPILHVQHNHDSLSRPRKSYEVDWGQLQRALRGPLPGDSTKQPRRRYTSFVDCEDEGQVSHRSHRVGNRGVVFARSLQAFSISGWNANRGMRFLREGCITLTGELFRSASGKDQHETLSTCAMRTWT